MKYRSKPTEVEAVKLTKENIRMAYFFCHPNEKLELNSTIEEDAWWERYEDIVKNKGMELKTPESGDGTQIASIGDYIVKGYSEKLGYHFWAVKADYFENKYEEITYGN